MNDAKRMGEPPTFYLVGRYDMIEKKFIADRFMCEKEITQKNLREAEEGQYSGIGEGEI